MNLFESIWKLFLTKLGDLGVGCRGEVKLWKLPELCLFLRSGPSDNFEHEISQIIYEEAAISTMRPW